MGWSWGQVLKDVVVFMGAGYGTILWVGCERSYETGRGPYG